MRHPPPCTKAVGVGAVLAVTMCFKIGCFMLCPDARPNVVHCWVHCWPLVGVYFLFCPTSLPPSLIHPVIANCSMRFSDLAYPLELPKERFPFSSLKCLSVCYRLANRGQMHYFTTKLKPLPAVVQGKGREHTKVDKEHTVKDSPSNNQIVSGPQHSYMQTGKAMQMQTLRCIRDLH